MPRSDGRFFALVAMVAAVLVAASGCLTASHPRERPPAPETSPAPAPPTARPLPPPPPTPGGNTRIGGFDEAKRLLARLYLEHSERRDVYCGCPFGPEPGRGLRVDLATCGYATARDPARAERIEWEHAVPASRFGRTFAAWREGDERCVDGGGKRFHGRTCARRASPEFARMEADLHNLFPVVGEVNGLRADLPMGLLDVERPPSKPVSFHFGACGSAIQGGVFFPRPEVRGDLARAYQYMDAAYPARHILDEDHRALFARWSHDDPPDAWERRRNHLIATLQGNGNPFIEPSSRP